MRYIPQIIHFIWFGRAEFPPIIKSVWIRGNASVRIMSLCFGMKIIST